MMIMDQQSPRALLQIGTVAKVIPGLDGGVLTVVVNVKDRSYTRPVTHLIRLPALPDDTNKD